MGHSSSRNRDVLATARRRVARQSDALWVGSVGSGQSAAAGHSKQECSGYFGVEEDDQTRDGVQELDSTREISKR